MSEVRELLKIAQDISRPDRDLDVLLWKYLEKESYRVWYFQNKGMMNRDWTEDVVALEMAKREKKTAPRFTSSVDLLLKYTPKGIKLGYVQDDTAYFYTRRTTSSGFDIHGQADARGRFIAVAICEALLEMIVNTSEDVL